MSNDNDDKQELTRAAELAVDAIRVAIEAMKAANIPPKESMVGMLMLCARIGRANCLTLEQFHQQVDNAWRVAGLDSVAD